MKIVVFGANGLLGSAIVEELRARSHRVAGVARGGAAVEIDLRFDARPEVLRAVVKGADIVVNAAGILIERDGNTFDAVHRRTAEALAQACEAERVARIVHISSLGVGTGVPGGYMASKLDAERAIAAGRTDYAIVRPGLLVDARSPSTRLFRFLAGLPVISLPGLFRPGASRVAPIHAADVARCVARIVEHPKALRRVIELAGPETMGYREMLRRYRAAAGKGPALWLPVPWLLMNLGARMAAWLPQRVFSIDTMRMLRAESVSAASETPRWLGREPTRLEGAVEPAPARTPAAA